MDSADLAVVQKSAKALDLILNGKDSDKPEAMDTLAGQREHLKGTCNWCGYRGHFKCECRQKASGKPKCERPPNNRKERTLSTPSASDAVVKDTVSKIVERV